MKNAILIVSILGVLGAGLVGGFVLLRTSNGSTTTTAGPVAAPPTADPGATTTSSSTPPATAAPTTPPPTTTLPAPTTVPPPTTTTSTTTTTSPTPTTTTRPPPTTTTIPNTAPSVVITAPAQTFYWAEFDPVSGTFGAVIDFAADANDPDGDDLDISWVSTVGGFIGSGPSITARLVVAGDANHPTVTVSVRDGRGGSASASINLIIAIPSDN